MSELDFLQAEQEEGGGSTYRTVGLMTFTLGYKVNARGRSKEESLFTYAQLDQRKAAEQKAKAFQSEAGAENDPDRVYAFVVPKDTVIAGGDNWNVDQYYLRSIWRDQLVNPGKDNEIDDRIVFNSVKDHVNEGRVKLGVPFFGSLQRVASPYHVRQGEKGKKDKAELQDGTVEYGYPTVVVLDTVYETEAEARDSAAVFATDPNVPQGWAKELWLGQHETIKAKYAEMTSGGIASADAIKAISKGTYDLDDVKYVEIVLELIPV